MWNRTRRSIPNEDRKFFAAKMSSDSATDDPEPDHTNVCVLWLCRRRGTLHGLGGFSDQPAEKNASTQSRNFAASPLQCEFREIIQCDRADDLETLCADFVHCIIS